MLPLLLLPLLAPVQDPACGFEGLEPGPLTRAETAVGGWTAPLGHAEVDPAHRRGGRQCLHLLGGEGRVVELEVPAGMAELRLWAERWTRRAPFEMRVERAGEGETWEELYRGDDAIVIGGFDTEVVVPLDTDAPQRLRFTCTSPESSGLLIDDVRLVRAAPMEVVSVTTEQPVVPCLVGNASHPLVRVVIRTQGNLQPIALQGLRFELGEGLSGLEFGVGCSGASSEVGASESPPFGSGLFIGAGSPPSPDERSFTGRSVLAPGDNVFWLECDPGTGLDPSTRLVAHCTGVELGGGKVLTPVPIGEHGGQRVGVRLRSAGDDGSKAYRIPGLVTTPRGTLIAVYDVRWKGWGDLPGDIDVGMSRSTDGGRSWEAMRVILDMGDDPDSRFDGVGDPAVLVDEETGTIWVAATWSHGNRAWRGSGPGLTPVETGQLVLTRSDDDGLTWSAPRNITAEVKRPEWCYLLVGPGRGICMEDGTLVFAAQYQDTPENDRLPHSTILFSSDQGETWQLGAGARPNTTEAQLVERDGELMLNMRDNRGGSRAVMTTTDLGRTWRDHPTTRSALIEPVCMASLLSVERELGRDADGVLLFSNPNVARAPRRAMTLRASLDGGESWPDALRLLLDEGRSAGYSCLTMVDEETVGVLYEGSRAHLTFQRVPLKDVLGR